MRQTVRLALVLALAAGCGHNPAANPDGGSPDGGANGKSYALTPFSLAPGEEKIMCYYVPADGVDRMLSAFTIDMKPGSHHLVVFRIQDDGTMPASGPTPCTQLDIPVGFDGMLPGSQVPHAEYKLPDGVAMRFNGDHGLYFQSHYINTSMTETITSGVTFSFTTMPDAQVQQTAGMIFYSNFKLNLPVGMASASDKCVAKNDMNLFLATGHMHRHGLTFDATVAGTPLYHADTWDDPPAKIYAPVQVITAGQEVDWTCTYNNDTGAPLRFGNSAATNEMCILGGIFYPSPGSLTDFCQ
jgi:hypothetical protein